MKKPDPFAEVNERHGHLIVAGRLLAVRDDPHGGTDALLAEAEHINAAVEEREAKLRSKMEAAAAALIDLRLALGVVSGNFYQEKADHLAVAALDQLRPEADAAPEYVHGDVACGLAWDLGAMQAKVEGEWGVLLDAMLEQGGEASELAWLLMDAIGLAATLPRRIDIRAAMSRSLSDDELAQECVRRGWSFDSPGRVEGFSPRTLIAIDESANLDDRAVAALFRGRELVSITNVETGVAERVEALGPVIELMEREMFNPYAEATRQIVDRAAPCVNQRCSRFNTRHGGIPCDTRRARGVAGKR